MPFGISIQKHDTGHVLKEALYLAHECANDIQATTSHKAQNILAAAGLKEKRKAGQGSMFWQFRPYEVGDTPKNIDWKRTGRGDKVIVKDRTEEQAETYRFWIDPALKGQSIKHYESLLYVLSLSTLIHENEDKTAPISKGKDTPTRGLKTLHSLFHHFSSFGQVSLENLKKISIPKSHTCVLFSDFWQPTEFIESTLKPLMRQHPHGILVQVARSEELTFPFVGRTFFKDFDNNERTYRIEDASSVQEAYLTKIEAHQNELKAFTKRHGWQLETVSDAKTKQENLKNLYNRLLHIEEKIR